MKMIAAVFILGLIVSAAVAAVPADKLVLYFSFEEEEGNLVKDLSKEGNDGEIQGGAEWSKEGKYGKALKFNAKDSFVLIPTSPSLEIDTELTVMAWIKWVDSGDTWLCVMSSGQQEPLKENYGMFINRTGRYLYFLLDLDNVYTRHQAPNGSTEPDVWQHFCGTYDGKTTSIYADGEIVFEEEKGLPLTSPGLDLRIGYRKDSTHFFNGLIDEVAIFEKALTQDEIKAAMKGLEKFQAALEPAGKLSTCWGAIKTSASTGYNRIVEENIRC